MQSDRTHTHSDMRACGKNNTAIAHGAIVDPRGSGRVLDAMPCDQVEEIRQRVARDITHESMNPWERLTSLLQGRGDAYTPEAYEAAWVGRQDLTAQQQGHWAGQELMAAEQLAKQAAEEQWTSHQTDGAAR